MSDKFDFSLVIACYCDGPHLYDNTLKLCHYLSATKLKYEIIFVEDCSPDNSKQEILRCQKTLEERGIAVKSIFHEKNIGRGGAVTNGFLVARGEVVGFIDIDLEHVMDAILPMVQKIQDGHYDVVTGKRLMLKPIFYIARSIASYCYRYIVKFFVNMPVTDSETGPKIFRRETLLPVLKNVQNKQWFWDTEVIHRSHLAGLRINEHPIVFTKNLRKQSTVKLFSDSFDYLRALRKHLKSVG